MVTSKAGNRASVKLKTKLGFSDKNFTPLLYIKVINNIYLFSYQQDLSERLTDFYVVA